MHIAPSRQAFVAVQDAPTEGPVVLHEPDKGRQALVPAPTSTHAYASGQSAEVAHKGEHIAKASP